MNHSDTQKHLPSSGWGYHWTGDPNKGYGTTQPGGWLYNLLPFLEQKTVHDMAKGMPVTSSGSGGSGTGATALAIMNGTVLSIYNCPSRRNGLDALIKDPAVLELEYNADDAIRQGGQVGQARSDYAGNAGTNQQVTTGSCQVPAGGAADAVGYDGANYMAPNCGWWSRDMNGVTFAASRISYKQITDGTSKTYFCGEKSLQPRFYKGGGPTDNGSMFEGHDWDILRWGGKDGNNTNKTPYTATDMLPLHDTDVPTDDNYGRLNFGSAHQSTCLFVMCDGSVQEVSYIIDAATHWKLCNRRDGYHAEAP